ncbi:hypothetical protein ACCO45_005018 [Purpureocillium lilacinum]|uniref:Uncharacterized protein n=1 Tax=Purpureocillium lilacinum TaxID=33203 RepID=A0ACC4DUG2_PURLI
MDVNSIAAVLSSQRVYKDCPKRELWHRNSQNRTRCRPALYAAVLKFWQLNCVDRVETFFFVVQQAA